MRDFLGWTLAWAVVLGACLLFGSAFYFIFVKEYPRSGNRYPIVAPTRVIDFDFEREELERQIQELNNRLRSHELQHLFRTH